MEIKKEDIKIGCGFCFGDKIYEVVSIFKDNEETFYVDKALECFDVYSYSIFYFNCNGIFTKNCFKKAHVL